MLNPHEIDLKIDDKQYERLDRMHGAYINTTLHASWKGLKTLLNKWCK